MKGNDGKGNIEEKDDWRTPKLLFQQLKQQYNFNFDCCASGKNAKVWNYTDDFLSFNNSDNHICWMNPPFSKATEMFEHFFKVVSEGVCIYRCDNMETKIWQDIILKHATWIFIPKGRISYEGIDGNGCRFPSALIGFNVDSPKNIEGTTLNIEEVKDGN